MTKMASRSLQADLNKALSKRARAAGNIDEAATLERSSRWHQQAAVSVHEHGNRLAKQSAVVNGEVASTAPGFRDTLVDLDLAAVESSEARGRLLNLNDAIALGVDLSKTVGASNTAEKLIAHEIAVAHKVAMEQANQAQWERDPAMAVKRLNVSARMMAAAQNGLLALQKLKSTRPQSVTVQHVHVNAGGQAVVGCIQSNARTSA